MQDSRYPVGLNLNTKVCLMASIILAINPDATPQQAADDAFALEAIVDKRAKQIKAAAKEREAHQR